MQVFWGGVCEEKLIIKITVHRTIHHSKKSGGIIPHSSCKVFYALNFVVVSSTQQGLL